MSSHALARSTKASYGVGNIGIQAVNSLVAFFLLFFYTDVALVSAGVASTALFVAKLWDIVNDPLFGWISDRTKSRFGKRRIYLIWGAVPMGIVTFLLFSMPQGMSDGKAILFIIASFVLFDTVYTMVSVPYNSMSAELALDYDERTSVLTYSGVGSVVGTLVGGALAPALFADRDDAAAGFQLAAGLFGALAAACIGFVAWKVRPQFGQDEPSEVPILEAIRETFKNKPFVRLIIAFGLARFGFTMVSTSLTFFVVHRLLEDEKKVGLILAILLVVVAIFIPFWKMVADKWSKGVSYAAGLTITAIGMAAVFLLAEGQTVGMLGLSALIGFGISAHWVIPWAMLPDVVEYDQAETGERREGMFFGVYGLIDKIARTLGLVSVGWALGLFGYDPSATIDDRAVLGIRLVAGPVPAVFLLLAVPILLAYPISRESHAKVRESIDSTSPAG